MRRFAARRAGGLLVVALPLVLAGCFWPVPGAGPDRQAHNALEDRIAVATVARLEPAWEARVDGGAAGDPVTSNAGVHVGDTTRVYGFATGDGARLWASDPGAGRRVGQPLARGEDVLVGRWNPTATEDTDPTASDATAPLDASTGEAGGDLGEGVAVALRDGRALLWEQDFIRLGRIRAPFWATYLHVVDLGTGNEVCCGWIFRLYGPAAPAPPLTELTLASDAVIHGGPGLNDTGPVPDPTIGGNGVRGYDFTALADPASCANLYLCPTWAVPLGGTTATPPVLSDDESVVYVGTDEGVVYAVDVATASIRWSAPVGSAVTDAPALAGGSLFVPTAAGDLVVLDAGGCGAATCAPTWTAATGSRITQQPAVANGVVFTGSASGAVRAFAAGGCDAPTCAPLWSDDTGSEITGAPAVSGGQLYAGTADGRLLAWRLPPS